MPNRVLTIDELILMVQEEHGLRLSRNRIKTWLADGVLIGFKLGGVSSPWLIDERDWALFIEGHRAEAHRRAAEDEQDEEDDEEATG